MTPIPAASNPTAASAGPALTEERARPQRRVYMLAPELLSRIRARQNAGGHANETETVRFLLTDALAQWVERTAARSTKGGRANG